MLFKRGEVWRGQLKPRSGTAQRPTLYGACGTGAKPTILGSVNRRKPSDWIHGIGHWSDREGVWYQWRNGGPLWRCTTHFDTDVGNLIFNGGTSVGFKIRNNIFYQYTQGLWVQQNPQWDAALMLANNFWSQAGGNLKPVGPARAIFLFSSYIKL